MLILGRAVYTARFFFDFSECIGVELLSSLYRESLKTANKFDSLYRQRQHFTTSKLYSFFEESILNFDWSDGDVVFANSTCFDDILMKHISREAEKLQPNTLVITFTKSLQSQVFFL